MDLLELSACGSRSTETGIIDNHELRDEIIRTCVYVKGLSEI